MFPFAGNTSTRWTPRLARPSRDFGENGRISLNRHTPDEARYFGFPGPFVVNDVIVVGGNGGGKSGEGYGDGGFEAHAKPEDIRGYDIHSGKLLWTFHILPHKGERATRLGAKVQRSLSATWLPGAP